MNSLTLRYDPSPDPEDETGQLWFDLRADRFSGSGFFWSNLSELPEIITRLKSYPWGDAATWAWGYDEAQGPDSVLSLQIEQANPRGGLKVSVLIRDLYDPEQRLQSTFQTDHAALEELRIQLIQLHQRSVGEGVSVFYKPALLANAITC